MNKLFKLLCFSLLFINISLTVFCYDINNDPPINVLKVIDNDSILDFPDRFRDMSELSISGSNQFTPSQLINIKNKYKNKNLIIVDLRQESHGFINNIAFSYYLKGIDLNHDLTTPQVILKEIEQISKIEKDDQVPLFRKSGIEALTVSVESTSTEQELCNINKLPYTRLAVVDGGIPTPYVVENFISFVKSIPPNSHVHFHCEEGKGRTTMLMTLYTILNSKPLPPLEEILAYQIKIGGITLTNNSSRAEFIQSFYNNVSSGKYN